MSFSFKLLQHENHELQFPRYTINRTENIFLSRQQLSDYVDLLTLHIDVLQAEFAKDHEGALEHLTRLDRTYRSPKKDSDGRNKSFARFTPDFVKSRLFWHEVEALQKLKRHQEATDLLQKSVLCSNTKYLRGRIYERLTLNLDVHLKQKQQALDVVRQGLDDKEVSDKYRVSIQDRLVRLEGYLKRRKKGNDADSGVKLMELVDAPTVGIFGFVSGSRADG